MFTHWGPFALSGAIVCRYRSFDPYQDVALLTLCAQC